MSLVVIALKLVSLHRWGKIDTVIVTFSNWHLRQKTAQFNYRLRLFVFETHYIIDGHIGDAIGNAHFLFV